MSYVRVTVWICACACALLATTAATPAAAAAPPRRTENKEPRMMQEKTIVIRRVPNAYFYPFSLWPLPKYPTKDITDSQDTYYHRRSLRTLEVERNKR